MKIFGKLTATALATGFLIFSFNVQAQDTMKRTAPEDLTPIQNMSPSMTERKRHLIMNIGIIKKRVFTWMLYPVSLYSPQPINSTAVRDGPASQSPSKMKKLLSIVTASFLWSAPKSGQVDLIRILDMFLMMAPKQKVVSATALTQRHFASFRKTSLKMKDMASTHPCSSKALSL